MKHFTKKQKKEAKLEHNRVKSNYPQNYHRERKKLVSHLVDKLNQRLPRWGSLKIIIIDPQSIL